MLEGLLSLFQARSPALILRDVLDISIVAYAIYRLLLLLRGTRAMQVSLGLVVLVLVYLGAQRAGLETAYTLLDRFLASSFLVVVVLFQSDLRRALMRVGTNPWLLEWRKDEETNALEEVIAAATRLAQKRVGGLVVFERDAALDDFVQQGTVLDAQVTSQLLYTVFLPGYENPLHDGAVIIRNARVWKAGTFLPLTANPSLDRTMGTRHRAALGISEETDAVVVVVSEERGQVSLCFNGNLVSGLNELSLRQALYGLFYSKRRAAALLKEKNSARESLVPPPRAAAATNVRTASPDNTMRVKTSTRPSNAPPPAPAEKSEAETSGGRAAIEVKPEQKEV